MDIYNRRNRPNTANAGLGWDWGGFVNLGPVRIPPTPPTVGMTDRAGTGQIWYLMWDGASHLLLTDALPQYAKGDYYIFAPWDGPFLGAQGWRLGVSTAYPGSGLEPPGTPHLIVDFPQGGGGYTSANHPIVAPCIAAPGQQSWPESTGWPSPQPPTVPGVPSSSPAPLGGGFAATQLAFATNTPPLVGSTYIAPSSLVPQPFHLFHYSPGGGGSGPGGSVNVLSPGTGEVIDLGNGEVLEVP